MEQKQTRIQELNEKITKTFVMVQEAEHSNLLFPECLRTKDVAVIVNTVKCLKERVSILATAATNLHKYSPTELSKVLDGTMKAIEDAAKEPLYVA